jgi:4-amino-4-deoxy-L-arabinose transferase-like glycosyltransferase
LAWLDDTFSWIEKHEYVAVTVLLLSMLATRLVSLGTLPDTLNPDEADNMQSALRILHGSPPDNGFFGFDWYGEPAFTAYVFALFINLFGVSQFAARLPTALVSVASLGLFYLLLRRRVSVLAALLACVLFGTQLWYVHLSRMAWNNLHVTLFTLAAMLCLLNAMDARDARRRWTWFAICGVYGALTLYSYPAGRLVLPSLFAVLPVAILRDRVHWPRILSGYVLVGSIAVLLFVPQALYIAQHWDAFVLRTSNVSMLNKPAFQAAPLNVLGSQLEANFLGLFIGQFNNMPSHFPVGEAVLDPITGALAALGMVGSHALRRSRKAFDTWLWWAIFLLGWFFTEVITERTPDAARAVGWMPALYFFAAFSIDVGLRWAGRLSTSGRGLAFGLASIVTLAIGATNLEHYVTWIGLVDTRQARDPYISVAEFPAWSAAIIQDAERHGGGFNVGFWRSQHPIDQNGIPIGNQLPAPAPTAAPSTAPPPNTPASAWPTVLETLGAGGRLSQPRAIALDHDHNIYVVDADPKVQAIDKFDASGGFERSWGRPGSADGEFTGAWAVVVDGQDRIQVLDEETGWVQVFDSSGEFITRWGGPSSGLYHPRAMTVDARGDLYITDTGGGRVVGFNGSGGRIADYGLPGRQISESERLVEPSGVTALPDGSLVVADASRGVLRKYDLRGTLLATRGIGQTTALDGPRLAMAPDGSFYATAPFECALVHLSASGEALDSLGNCQNRDYLDFPSGLALDTSGKLYVADLNRRVVTVLGRP